jgi:hypothetical protein
MTKIKSIELEMTPEEKVTADNMWIEDSCDGVDCTKCPLGIADLLTTASNFKNCIFDVSRVAENLKIIVMQPELKLYEGMDTSRLKFRDQPDLRILDVYDTSDGAFPITVTARHTTTRQVFTYRVNTAGEYWSIGGGPDAWDIIWKEEITK